jgi:hypothetical protein
VAVAKRRRVASASGACMFVTSMTVSTPTRAASRPLPVERSTPHERATPTLSCPPRHNASTVWRPTPPVPPITAMRIDALLGTAKASGAVERLS